MIFTGGDSAEWSGDNYDAALADGCWRGAARTTPADKTAVAGRARVQKALTASK